MDPDATDEQQQGRGNIASGIDVGIPGVEGLGGISNSGGAAANDAPLATMIDLPTPVPTTGGGGVAIDSSSGGDCDCGCLDCCVSM
mmetsp:Transcript_10124/g.19475  ORF Transcript_10124/g.19475 Transcript_10124/m.19475 type:complete len:86 (-) Transcript_10124:30-287(-)